MINTESWISGLKLVFGGFGVWIVMPTVGGEAKEGEARCVGNCNLGVGMWN